MTQIKTIITTEYPSGIFQVIINFDSNNFSGPYLADDGMLYFTDSAKSHYIQTPESIYNGKDTRDYAMYYNTEKQQVVFTFIPFALVDNPTLCGLVGFSA